MEVETAEAMVVMILMILPLLHPRDNVISRSNQIKRTTQCYETTACTASGVTNFVLYHLRMVCRDALTTHMSHVIEMNNSVMYA